MDKQPGVYILASERNGKLYIGITSDLIEQIWEHKVGFLDKFTQAYETHILVWYELHETITSAARRGNVIKNWRRELQLNMIRATNPTWRDLYSELF